MPNLAEKQAATKAATDRHRKDAEILCQKFADLFSTDTGKEVLSHLWQRFEVEGRTYIANAEGTVCPIRAAIRDGERAAIAYIYAMARKANPNLSHP